MQALCYSHTLGLKHVSVKIHPLLQGYLVVIGHNGFRYSLICNIVVKHSHHMRTTGTHTVSQINLLFVWTGKRVHRNDCISIAAVDKSKAQLTQRLGSKSFIVDHRSLTKTAKPAVYRLCAVTARQIVGSQLKL